MPNKTIVTALAGALLALSGTSTAHAAGSFTPTVSGSARALTLDVRVEPDAATTGYPGNLYVAANLSGAWYFKTPAGWRAWTPGTPFPAYREGAPLTPQTIGVLAGEIDLSPLVGARIYVGYGTSESDMMANGRIALVHTVGPGSLMRIASRRYDGEHDDLLTAGLGQSGIGSATSPAAASGFSAANPEHVRRLAIYNNTRALIDPTPAGGYGTLYGPNVGNDGRSPFNDRDGRIAGHEMLGLLDPGDGSEMVTLMVQIPDHFDRERPCLVTATSSGSRGIYGAIGTAGDWGLKQGCAVVYNDKGSGSGAHALALGTVTRAEGLYHGTRAPAFAADGSLAIPYPHFVARDESGQPIAPAHPFNAQTPHRYAFKHAHSMRNPEKDWGQHVLASIRFALDVLNEQFGGTGASGLPRAVFAPKGREGAGQTGVLVIASSVSNGGGAALRAAEADSDGLITALAVSEPQVQPDLSRHDLTIASGNALLPPGSHGRSLFDVVTQYALLQPCASLAQPTAAQAGALNGAGQQANRCRSLARAGLLPGIGEVDTGNAAAVTAAATVAQQQLNAYGLLPEQNAIAPSYEAFRTHSAVAVAYANAYGRFAVTQNLCGYSYAATDAGGAVVPLAGGSDALLFSTGNGVPPTGGINLINNRAPGGARNDNLSVSPGSHLADLNVDGVLCLRRLALGVEPATGAALAAADQAAAQRVRAGIAEVRASGNLRGKPAIIVHGRADALVPVNHSARPYYALNQAVEGTGSRLRYVEVIHGHHLDAFNAFYPTLTIPLHVYLGRALNAVFAHVREGAPLPASQVVRTTTRASAAEVMSAARLPALAAQAAPGDAITFAGNTLNVPQ